jgi:hypothetical protein
MELQGDVLVSPRQEVSVLEGELVATIRELASRGVGSKTIAQTVGVARNTVRRYLRRTISAGVQTRPGARRLSEPARAEARVLYEGPPRGTPSWCTVSWRSAASPSAYGRSSERRGHSRAAPGRRSRDGSRRPTAAPEGDRVLYPSLEHVARHVLRGSAASTLLRGLRICQIQRPTNSPAWTPHRWAEGMSREVTTARPCGCQRNRRSRDAIGDRRRRKRPDRGR